MDTDQVISELTGKIEFLLNRQVQMEQKSRELTLRVQRLESYEEDNKNLRQENTELKDENADLKTKIAELKSRLTAIAIIVANHPRVMDIERNRHSPK